MDRFTCGDETRWGEAVTLLLPQFWDNLQALQYTVGAEWEMSGECAFFLCQPVAADLKLQRTTYWTSWIHLPMRASHFILPTATRGWYIHLTFIKYAFKQISIYCVLFLEVSFHYTAEPFVMFLFLHHVSPSLSLCLQFCLTSAAYS